MIKTTLVITLLVLLCSGLALATEGKEQRTCGNGIQGHGIPASDAPAQEWEVWAKKAGLTILDKAEPASSSLTTCPFTTCDDPSCNITIDDCSGLTDTGLTSCTIPGGSGVSCTGGKTIWTADCACKYPNTDPCGRATTQIVCQ